MAAPGRVVLAVAILLSVAVPAVALDRARALSHYIHDEWGAAKGYGGGPVYGFAQGPDGFLWIATARGLIRFDGLKFESVALPQAAVASGAPLVGVAAADNGEIWSRLGAYSVLAYRDGAFSDVVTSNRLSRGVVGVLATEPGGGVLLASYGVGVIRFRDGRFETLVRPQLLPRTLVMSVAVTGTQVWLGTRDAGLFRFDGRTIQRLPEVMPDEKINALLPGDDGDLWIGTDRGVVRWTRRGVVPVPMPPALGVVPALALLRDHDGNVWIAAGARGVVRVNAGGASWFRGWDARVRGVATTLFEDRERNLWIGTSRGVERLRDGVFATYADMSGSASERVGPVHVDRTGRTWFGTTEGGLFRIEPGGTRAERVAALASDVVYSLDGDDDGGVWVGRRFGGLTRLDVTAAGVRATSFGATDGLAQDGVYVVHASAGAVWAGTLSGGVSRLANGRFETFTVRDGLVSDTVTAISEAPDRTMWFGSPQGLSRLSKGAWRTYTTDDGLPSNEIQSLLVDRDGGVWSATVGGLAVLRAGEDRFVRVAGLAESVTALVQDRLGYLWASMQDRLVRFLPAGASGAAGIQLASLRDFDALDGLLTRESIKRQRTLAVDGQGRIWFASTAGLAVADPSRLADAGAPGVLTIRDVSADDTIHRATQRLALRSSRRVSISFTGVSLTVPERIRYRYRLDGFDAAWSRPGVERTAVYTNLGPGHYVFRVSASDAGDQWTGGEQTLAFELLPAVWQTTPFRAAACLGLAGLLAAAYRMRTAQLARQLNVRFEERLAERTRIAQELHDTLLQGFLGAAMHLQVVAASVPDGSTTRGQLAYVADLMKRVIDEGRHAIQGLRSPGGHLDDLPMALTGVARELGIAQATKCRVIVDGKARPVHPLVRDEVYRIGREALANAIRHASATLIEVELGYRPDRLVLVVRDDGVGIDEQVALSGRAGHWGLSGMRERAEAVGGHLRVRSRAAAGTEVELSIPATLAFRDGQPPSAGSAAGTRSEPARPA